MTWKTPSELERQASQDLEDTIRELEDTNSEPEQPASQDLEEAIGGLEDKNGEPERRWPAGLDCREHLLEGGTGRIIKAIVGGYPFLLQTAKLCKGLGQLW